MEVLLVPFEFPGADAHECNSVAVGLVHVCLDFENEGRKALIKRVDLLFAGQARKRRHCHMKKALQKRLHPKIVQSRSEEDRAEQTGANRFDIEIIAGAVQQLDVV